jgi:hypothetical protein
MSGENIEEPTVFNSIRAVEDTAIYTVRIWMIRLSKGKDRGHVESPDVGGAGW